MTVVQKMLALLVVAASSLQALGQTDGRVLDPLDISTNTFSRKSATRSNEEGSAALNANGERYSVRVVSPSEQDDIVRVRSGFFTAQSDQESSAANGAVIESAARTPASHSPAGPSRPFAKNQQPPQRYAQVPGDVMSSQAWSGGPSEATASCEPAYDGQPKYGETAGHLPVGSAGLFTFSSARHKRNAFGTMTFDSIPNPKCACDEWCSFCDCGKCGNDLGLDVFRRKCSDRHQDCGECETDCNPLPKHRIYGKYRPSLGPSQ